MPRVWVRGLGELGTGVAHLLHRLGYSVMGSELQLPRSIRQPVCFSQAMFTGSTQVEGVEARAVAAVGEELEYPATAIPVLKDSDNLHQFFKPDIYIDARMLKKDVEDSRSLANCCIGLGPGFEVNRNCHIVIETRRGHTLGRVILQGGSEPDTGVPGVLGGKGSERLIRSPGQGFVKWEVAFGALVKQGEIVGRLSDGSDVITAIEGMMRGMISPQVPVEPGMKIGDVDPRGAVIDYRLISDKTRLIASGVLEAILLKTQGDPHG